MKNVQTLHFSPDDTPEAIVAQYYARNGYCRIPRPTRIAQHNRQVYKKGHEVRIVVNNLEELEHLRTALVSLGFKLGRPYPKHSRMIQPIYGKQAVERFQTLINAFQSNAQGVV